MHKAPAIAIHAIRQVDNDTFEILWSDETTRRYHLGDLQRNCPCATCVDELSGERKAPSTPPPARVGARRIFNVGRYALRIEFTTGCSTGIYNYDFLHTRGEQA